jgi:Pre-mRNA splicing factor PRP21 like protein/Surp module
MAAAKITGFIRPPPGVREVVEKTAAFVARGGPEFEAKIKSSDSSGKFAFLSPDHPYNAYYKHKVTELQQQASAPASASATAPQPTKEEGNDAASASNSADLSKQAEPKQPAAGATTEESKPQQQKGVIEIPHPISKAIKFLQAQAKAVVAMQKEQQQQQQQNQGAGTNAAAQGAMEEDGSSNTDGDKDGPLDTIQSIIKALPPPAQDQFSPPHPSYLTQAEIEVIKLTAQFTAAQGKTFLMALQAREGEIIRMVQQQQGKKAAIDVEKVTTAPANAASGGGPFSSSLMPTDFDFLKPSHPAFSYFTSLVDQYHLILHPSAYTMAKIRADAGMALTTSTSSSSSSAAAEATNTAAAAAVGAKSAILARCVHRMESRRLAEEKRREKEAALRGDLSGGAGGGLIDWHDFVVVGTISFDDEEEEERDRYRSSSSSSSSSSRYAAPQSAKDELGIHLPTREPLDEDSNVPSFISAAAEKINVRTDYRPNVGGAAAASAASAAASSSVVIDPRTGMVIPLEQASEHVRIGLLDPKWKQQRDLNLARRSDTLYASGDQVAENLKNLASKRGDVFASERNSEALGPPLAKRARVAAAGEGDDEDAPPGT